MIATLAGLWLVGCMMLWGLLAWDARQKEPAFRPGWVRYAFAFGWPVMVAAVALFLLAVFVVPDSAWQRFDRWRGR